MKIVTSGLAALTIGFLLWSVALAGPAETQDRQFKSISLQHQVKNLIGLNVENSDGEHIAKIKDFVVNLASGEVEYVILSSGGILGVNSTVKVAPARALYPFTAKTGTAALRLDEGRWDGAPVFKKSALPWLADPHRIREIYQYYGMVPEHHVVPAKPPRKEALSITGREIAPPATTNSSPQNLRLVTDLLGRKVHDQTDKSLGVFVDLLIDVTGNRTSMALISTNDWFHSNGRFAFPVRRLVTSSSGRLTLQASESDFQRAKTLDADTWRKISRIETTQIYEFEN